MQNAFIPMLMPLLPILLSIGAINALIPIMLIIILIAAAAGATRGYSFFNIFGISTLMGGTFTPGGKGTLAKSGLPFRAMLDVPGGTTFGKKSTWSGGRAGRAEREKNREKRDERRTEYQKSLNRAKNLEGNAPGAKSPPEPNKNWQRKRPFLFFFPVAFATGMAEVFGGSAKRILESRRSGNFKIPEDKLGKDLKIEREFDELKKINFETELDKAGSIEASYKLRQQELRRDFLQERVNEITKLEKAFRDGKIKEKAFAKEFYKIMRSAYGETNDFFLFKLFDPVHGRSTLSGYASAFAKGDFNKIKKEMSRAPNMFFAPKYLFLSYFKIPFVHALSGAAGANAYAKRLNNEAMKQYVRHGLIKFPAKEPQVNIAAEEKKEEKAKQLFGEGWLNLYAEFYKRRDVNGEPETPTLLRVTYWRNPQSSLPMRVYHPGNRDFLFFKGTGSRIDINAKTHTAQSVENSRQYLPFHHTNLKLFNINLKLPYPNLKLFYNTNLTDSEREARIKRLQERKKLPPEE